MRCNAPTKACGYHHGWEWKMGGKAGFAAASRSPGRGQPHTLGSKNLSQKHIKYLTLYGFSSENWNRPEEEVQGIFRLLEERIDREAPNFTAIILDYVISAGSTSFLQEFRTLFNEPAN